MSIKKTSKLFKFLTASALSVIVGLLAVVLFKKQEGLYPLIKDYKDNVTHADAPAVIVSGSDSSDGNDGSDGC